MKVAALYIDHRGPYPNLLGPEMCWDEARDARTYAGPWPVVAHPPCGPWGSLHALCTRQSKQAGPDGVAAVRRWGGVLEHSAHSKLFRHCGMPFPNELPDAYGGRTFAVDQVAWGHRCRKATWIYVVRAIPSLADFRSGGVPSHVVTTSRRIRERGGQSLPELSRKWERAITPPAFAEWLVSLAAQASQTRRSA